MSYFLKFLLSLFLIPVFLVLLFLAVPILMMITSVTSRTPRRRVHVKTFTASWPPEQPENRDASPDAPVYDVECTVISSTPMGENQTTSKPPGSSPGEASVKPAAPSAAMPEGRNTPPEKKI